MYSVANFRYLIDENVAAVTDAYWELILSIGGDGFAEIVGCEDGMMLLHYVAASRSSKDMMQRTIQLYPPAVMKGNKNNWLPLYFACYYNRRVAAKSLAVAFLHICLCRILEMIKHHLR